MQASLPLCGVISLQLIGLLNQLNSIFICLHANLTYQRPIKKVGTSKEKNKTQKIQNKAVYIMLIIPNHNNNMPTFCMGVKLGL
jgi:hypothetical protein